jgi:transcriptional regulator with XRE-family HTH domain
MPIRDPVLKRFGGNVRAKREARKLSQEALAEQAGFALHDAANGWTSHNPPT